MEVRSWRGGTGGAGENACGNLTTLARCDYQERTSDATCGGVIDGAGLCCCEVLYCVDWAQAMRPKAIINLPVLFRNNAAAGPMYDAMVV